MNEGHIVCFDFESIIDNYAVRGFEILQNIVTKFCYKMLKDIIKRSDPRNRRIVE